MQKKRLVVIVGPTGAGKTALAERLAACQPSRLLSADSQQVYRGLDIGTAKPLGAAKQAWSLLDLVDPGQAFSTGDWVRLAAPACVAAWAEDRLPIIAGGTGLYLKALLDGLAEIPATPETVRQALAQELALKGLPALAERLGAVDPELAGRTDLANPRRVLRGLEVYAATGKPLSRWQAETTVAAVAPDQTLWIGLDPGQEALETALAARTDTLWALGWPQEVARLADRYGDTTVARSSAIGYPELLDLLRGRSSPESARAAIRSRTRQYARRQRTWFRSVPGVLWLSDAGSLAGAGALLDGASLSWNMAATPAVPEN